MTDGPESHVALELPIPFPRAHVRAAVLEHADYFPLRNRLIGFLEDHTRQFKAT